MALSWPRAMGLASARFRVGWPRTATAAAPNARRAVAGPDGGAECSVATTAFFSLTSQPRTVTSLAWVSELSRGLNSVMSWPRDRVRAAGAADRGGLKYKTLSLTKIS